ncbi:YcaO-like family protein, partial [Saccharothrix sp. Mg75]|uniref:YcaO-like family protein n=1 Tax=Saccharothrix sp. Mg75 TaxID=3445357 RepID=UPI003EEA5DD4
RDGAPGGPPRERELPLPGARDRACAELDALGWRAELEVLADAPLTAVRCALVDATGAPVVGGAGSGKGDVATATVGALFESLEHVFTGPALADDLPVLAVPVAELARGPLAVDAAVAELARAQPRAHVACLPHADVRDGRRVEVPLFLWAPWSTSGERAGWRRGLGDDTDYARVKSYSVNTGCAIGATEDEAVLHALGECAERDAFSLFLLRCVHDRATPPRRIARHLLADDTADLLAAADDVLGGRVDLVDLTTDLDVPVVLALDRGGPGPARHRYGLGASTSSGHAVRRAVGELVQTALVTRGVDDSATGAAVARALGRHPRLLAAASVDVPDEAVDTPGTAARFGEDVPPAPVPALRREITERVLRAGHDVLVRRLAGLAHGTTTVQVHCPGLERFHLVTAGHVALPGPRARRLRNP